MTRFGRLAVLCAGIEIASWMLATSLRPGAWRYNISDLYAWGAPRPWLVMVGEAAFSIGLAALAFGLCRALPPSDHRLVGTGLLLLASTGAMAGALARNRCEESVPRCAGQAFATTGDWVHGIGGLVEILGIVGGALVLSATMSRRWSSYSVVTGCAACLALLAWGAVGYPWVGTAERFLAIALVGWVAAIGSQLASQRRASGMIRHDLGHSEAELGENVSLPGLEHVETHGTRLWPPAG